MNKPLYIKINAIYRKLRTSEQEETTFYLHAPVGTGKTMAVQYYYRNREKETLWLSGRRYYLPEKPSAEELQQAGTKIIVIDDLSWITDDDSIRYILDLIHHPEFHVVLIGRSRVPGWLMREQMEEALQQADIRDLMMEPEHVEAYLKERKIKADDHVIARIHRDTQGYPLALAILTIHLEKGTPYSPELLEQTRQELFDYFDYAFFDQWRKEEQELLLSVAGFDSFDLEFARMLTYHTDVMKLLDYAYSVGDFLQRDGDDRFVLHPLLKEYLLWKRKRVWSGERCSQLHERASVYYELKGDIIAALMECQEINNQERVIDLLEKNALQQTGTGHYLDTSRFYSGLTEQTLLNHPILMAGEAMRCSMLQETDRSEVWYQKLKDFAADPWNGNQARMEARNRIAYLDLMLPHRKNDSVLAAMKRVSQQRLDHTIEVPELSVSDGFPSILNGGRDFTPWCSRDVELTRLLRKPLEDVLGVHGAGVAETALAESVFEKADQDDYEVITLLNVAYRKAETRGTADTCFAVLGAIVRCYILHGQMERAEDRLAAFKMRQAGKLSGELTANLHALEAWMSLLRCDQVAVRAWFDSQLSEVMDFRITNRYQYLIKLRCYIAMEKYDAAQILLACMKRMFTDYERPYMKLELELLQAILSQRQKLKGWQKQFERVYREAGKCHFVWLIAQEGIAVLPLLQSWEAGHPEAEADEYHQLVKARIETMVFQYPAYLTAEAVLSEPLTETEQRILQLNSCGKTLPEILELCKISKRTLRFHNGNIYRKLGVKNKGDSILAAKQLGLLT